MLFFLVTCEEEKDLNKYLDSSYTSVVEFISTEIANKFCSGCEVFNSPSFLHVCLLSKNDKINEFGKEALSIAVKCGTIHRAFYNKTVKKDLFTIDEIKNFIKQDREKPKKFKDVKKLFGLERF